MMEVLKKKIENLSLTFYRTLKKHYYRRLNSLLRLSICAALMFFSHLIAKRFFKS
jgi:hypothetical protein